MTYEVYRITPQGQLSFVDNAIPQTGNKCQSVFVLQSGDKLILLASDFDLANEGRKYDVTIATFHGVCVPYPEGHPQVGMAGAFVGGDSEQEDTDVDYDRIRAIVREEAQVDRVVGNMKSKAIAAITEAKVVTETMFRNGNEGGSFIIYDQLKNTSYTGAKGALEEQEG